MQVFRVVARIVVLLVSIAVLPATAQVPKTLQSFGAPVYPAFEGWYQNADGSATILIGYFNSNQTQTVDLPIGELNRFSPGPEDRGQPTRFEPGRSWGVFSVEVPGDFDSQLSWTLVANENPINIPFHLEAPYFVEPFRDASNNNEPPTIKFAPDGTSFTGPPAGIAHTATATIGTPVDVGIWLTDVVPDTNVRENPRRRRPAMSLRWSTLRGPGQVEFDESVQDFEDASPQTTMTTVTFDVAGEYWLRAEALDSTGEGGSGFQCCWTSAIVKVDVTP